MNNISIIKGDTYEADLTIVGLENLEVVDKCVFSCKYLKFCKDLEKNENTFRLYLSPDETKLLNPCKSDYDITLYFTDRNVATVIYSGTIQIYPKNNC